MDGTVPLSILDLAPIVSGGTAAQAYQCTIDLARHAEQAGYLRYWLAEHHFTPGVGSSQPALLIGAVAAATERIRVGSGAVQLGHQTPVSVVEQFGMLDALYPGRIDLGLGRTAQRRTEALRELAGPPPEPVPARVVDGLLIPPPFSYAPLFASARLTLHARLLQLPGAQPPDFADQVHDILALLAGGYRAEGLDVHAVPGEGARVAVWLLGSSGGQSARLAGRLGLPFAANYHVAPAAVLEAAAAYRAAFQPSAVLATPYLMVSADAVVAPDGATARELAAPYALWVHSIRTGAGAMPFPTPAEAAAYPWTEEDRALVADRVDTQFVGAPETVAAGLRTLQRVTGADELLVTTVTHAHADRVRSYDLLAKAWHAGTSW
ncbi:MAG TPA: LLM class flavin-dependent oxidoreductase [Rugosimonospora sp.]|nr:LLM class flavin-dependent oxidoreductase [Rugosimonospora sp.]